MNVSVVELIEQAEQLAEREGRRSTHRSTLLCAEYPSSDEMKRGELEGSGDLLDQMSRELFATVAIFPLDSEERPYAHILLNTHADGSP